MSAVLSEPLSPSVPHPITSGGPGRHGVLALAALAVCCLWAATGLYLRGLHDQSVQATVQNGANLARAFEEHIIRALQPVDQTLRNVSEAYARAPETFDVGAWTRAAFPRSDLAFQLSLIDAGGRFRGSNIDPTGRGVDLSDREHFKVHVASNRDELFISHPIVGRISGKSSLNISRRVVRPDGTFAGVVVASVDPYILSKFYDTIDIGRLGAVTLFGTDGVVRARSGMSDIPLGTTISPRGRLLDELQKASAGTYTNAGGLDTVKRLYTYRVVRGFPLVVVVGQAYDEFLADFTASARVHIAAGVVFTILILGGAFVVARYQKRIRIGKARYRAVIDGLRQVVFHVDATGRLVVVNEAWRTIFGEAPETALGRALHEVIHPADREILERLLGELANGSEVRRAVLRFMASGGAVRWIEIDARLGGDISGEHEGISGTLMDVTERHEAEMQTQAAWALVRQRQYALDQAAIVVMTDHRHRIVYVNDRLCEMTGYRRDELLDADVAILRSAAHVDAFYDDIRARIAAGEVWRDELCARMKDGRLRWVYATIVPMHDRDGQVSGFIEIAFDITDRKEAEKALAEARDAAEESSRARTAFLAMMSHEIRTPLNGVIGIADLLSEGELAGESAELVKTLRASADHLMAIVSDVLDFTKLDAGKLEIEEHEFDLLAFIEETANMLASRACAKGIRIATVCAGDLPSRVVGDSARLRQVLLNLIGNSIKFTEHGGVTLDVTRAVRRAGRRELCFVVRDTGAGIPQEAISRLFHEFSQVVAADGRRSEGTGLGLALSKRIIEAMGGTIELSSEVGVGTTVRFTVVVGEPPALAATPPLIGRRVLVRIENPIVADALLRQCREYGAFASSEDVAGQWDTAFVDSPYLTVPTAERTILLHCPTAAPTLIPEGWVAVACPLFSRRMAALVSGTNAVPDAAEGAALPPIGAHRVLVAEDNATNRMIAVRLLRSLGIEADVVVDGVAAVAAVTGGPYDLVLMDVMMPLLDGLAATRAIRALPGPERKIHIIALTANAFQQDMAACREAGMDDFVAKPVSRNALAAALRRWIKRWESASARNEAQQDASEPAQIPGGPLPVFDAGTYHEFGEQIGTDGADLVLAAFLDDARVRLEAMQTANGGDVAREAHALKSSAATLGFVRFAALAKALEARATANASGAFGSDVAELAAAFDDVRRQAPARAA